MKIIKELCCDIEEEVCDAEKYARKALLYKEEYPALARTYHNLADEEIGHASKLHAHVAQLIDEYNRQNGEPPAAMKAVYEFLHQRQIDKAAEVKVLTDMFN